MTTGTSRIREGLPLLLFLSLLGANLLPAIAATVAAPALPSIARAFAGVGDIDRLVPLVLTLPPLAVAISGPFIGLLVDRVGSRPVLLVAAVVYALAGASALLVPSLEPLLVGRFVLGLAVCALVTGATTLIGQLLDGPARARMLARQSGVVAVIATGFIALSGVLADVSWRAPFALYLLALPIGLIFVRSIPAGVSPTPELPPGGRPSVPTLPTAIAAVTSSGAPGYLPGARRDLRVPTGSLLSLVATMFMAMAVLQSLYYLVALNIPFSMEARFDASATVIGIVVALLMLAFAIGALSSVRLSQLLEPRASVSVAAALVGLGHLLMSGLMPGAAMIGAVFPAALMAGIGYGLIAPNLIAWLAAVAPPQLRGRLFGGMTGSLFLGQFLSPYLWGPATSTFGREGAIAVSGVFALVVCILLAATVVVRPQRNGAHPGHAAVLAVSPRSDLLDEVPANPGVDDPGHGRHIR